MPDTVAAPRIWRPQHVFVTRAAAERPHAAEIVRRCELVGVQDIRLLRTDRLPDLRGVGYADAKSTLAVVVAPPSTLKLQPIPPSADWRMDLARGCPAHCQYCYLAGSLTGPPITRVYANLEDVLAQIPAYVGSGRVTSGTVARGHEGTTFEASCYTDPLAIEPLTGSVAAAITHVGTTSFDAPVQLRFTTKFDGVGPLLDLPHHGRTRIRFSINAAGVADRFEGGTARLPQRLAALRRVAVAGYPVGLTIAPVMPIPDWRIGYGQLLDDVAAALAGVPGLDLTAEIISHRFTPTSKDVLLDWYPRTKLEMDEPSRSVKRNKFGGTKYVYPKERMTELRTWFTAALADRVPAARLLYWT